MTKTHLVSEEVLRGALEVIEGCDYERTGVQQVDEALRAILSSPPSEPVAWMTDIVGYGYFIDGKLMSCSQSEIHMSIGSKNVECRPLYSVKVSK